MLIGELGAVLSLPQPARCPLGAAASSAKHAQPLATCASKMVGTAVVSPSEREKAGLEASAAASRWSIFTHHGHVLLFLAGNLDARVRDIAQAVGVTQRTAHVILRDLRAAGYITSTTSGRRNNYRLVGGTPLHHPAEARLTVADLLDIAKRSQGIPEEPGPDRPRFVF